MAVPRFYNTVVGRSLSNTRLHLTAPRELLQIQPVANRCSLWVSRPSVPIADVPGGSAWFTTG
ncbi:MAG: hypothetical protein Q7R41_11200 [Phycisphaerales bacterium]|nr:hypothetical protein [Phycisphaerales bacterium]